MVKGPAGTLAVQEANDIVALTTKTGTEIKDENVSIGDFDAGSNNKDNACWGGIR